MSDVMGVNFTKAYAGAPGDLLGAEWRGKVRAVVDHYEASGLAAASTIKVAKARKGDVFLGGKIIADDLTSAGTISVGDSGDADRFLVATVFTTAGQVTEINRMGDGTAETAVGVGYKFTADTDILLTTATEALTGSITTVIYLASPN